MRRVIWIVIGAGALALGIILTPLVGDVIRLWLAVCVLVAGSIAGIYYDSKAADPEDR